MVVLPSTPDLVASTVMTEALEMLPTLRPVEVLDLALVSFTDRTNKLYYFIKVNAFLIFNFFFLYFLSLSVKYI